MNNEKKMRTIAAAMIALVVATGAQAEEGLYGGVGLSYGSADSFDNLFGFTSEAEGPAFGLTLGHRSEKAQFFFGPELDGEIFLEDEFEFGGTPCATIASGPYYCSRSSVFRLRGVVGHEVGDNYELFGTVGYGVVIGQGASNSFTTDRAISGGLTASLGMQRDLANGAALRVEAIYDDFNDTLVRPSDAFGNSYDPEYEAKSVKVTYLKKF